MSKIEILKQEMLSKKIFPLKYITYTKPGPQANVQSQENEVYFRPDAVAVLLADPQKQIFLLTRQFRLPSYLNGNETGYLVESCAGLIDEGESPEQAARREVKEETGYLITELKKIGAVYSSAGGITEFLHLFIGFFDSSGSHEGGGGLEEEGEDIETIEISFEQAKDNLRKGLINDAKTLALLQHFFMNASTRQF